jgi:hypothetical protein
MLKKFWLLQCVCPTPVTIGNLPWYYRVLMVELLYRRNSTKTQEKNL